MGKLAGTLVPISGMGGTTPAALDAQADIGVLCAFERLLVVEIGVLVTVALDNTPNALVLAFDVIPNSGATRVEAAVGTVTSAVDLGVGIKLYKRVSYSLAVGDLLVAEVTTAATAGDGYPYAIVVPQGAGIGETGSVLSV
jgi:hypothetical protein